MSLFSQWHELLNNLEGEAIKYNRHILAVGLLLVLVNTPQERVSTSEE
jgi:hypothetical protein